MSNITVTGTLTDKPVAAQTINFRRVAQIPTGWSADPAAFSAVSDASGAWSVSLPPCRTGDEYWVARVVGSPAETWFYLSPSAASPSTIDAVKVKALTDVPGVVPDDAGGTVDLSGLLALADPAGVTVEAAPNTVTGSGTISVLTFPANTTAFAIKLEGDAHPRWLFNADAYDGVYFGDGTFDPYQDGTASISYNSGGGMYIGPGDVSIGNVAFRNGKGPILRDDANGHTYRLGTHNGALTITQVT